MPRNLPGTKIGLFARVIILFILLLIFNVFVYKILLPNIDRSLPEDNGLSLVVALTVGGNTLFIVFILFNSLFLGLSAFLTKNLVKKLNYLRNKITVMNSGNLDENIELVGNGEIAELSKSLEQLRTNLRERINSSQEAKDRAEAILLNVGEGVFAVNLKGEIIIFNKVAEKLIGLGAQQVLGQKYDQILQFYNGKTKQPLGSFINQVLLDGKSVTLPGETLLITGARAEIPVAVNSSPIKNIKGIIVGGIVIFRDITHEKEIEEIRSDLISIASHQLRTPLSEIKGLVDLLENKVAGALNEKQLEYLKFLKQANDRMINLVNDLLNISRIEQGRLQLNFQLTNLGNLSKEVFQTLRLKATQGQQVFSLTIDPNLPEVIADVDKTKEIISNLMENALKYTPQRGTIRSRVSANTDSVWVLVQDNGVGIPKNKQKDLFKKFSRVENPLSKITSGTGLGLYAVKQLVEKQSGQVWFSSDEGKGSTFAFSLPVAQKVKV